MKAKAFITVLVLLACALHAGGQARLPEYEFTHLNTSNSSLCYDGVSKIVQDSRGYIWIGTFSGLNRYDGTHFKHYRKKELGLAVLAAVMLIDLRQWLGETWKKSIRLTIRTGLWYAFLYLVFLLLVSAAVVLIVWIKGV